MRFFGLVALTMIAFAANSVLNRMALAGGGIDAVAFGSIRLVAGAVMLGALCVVLRGGLRLGGPGRVIGVAALLVYIYGFSGAYEALDAGLGALVLFGMVQITMFAAALWGQEAVPLQRWVGALMAMAGLAWLLWPNDAQAVSLRHAGLMAAAGVAWGMYSLAGRRAVDALQETAATFAIAAVIGVGPGLWIGEIGAGGAAVTGVALAVLAGAVTSGLGYALWYSLLPRLAASVAAVAQLTVPVIAMVGGMVVLGEGVSLRFALAAALVLGGVAVSVLGYRGKRISKGS